MRVEVTEKKLKDAGYDLVEGDSLTVPDEIGARWCRFGWARDPSGRTPTGVRKPGVQKLEPHNARHATIKRGGR